MKPLQQNEIFENLNGFLKERGIELKEGSYAQGVQKSCALLTNAINLGQQSWKKAKNEMDKSFDQMRQAIHEKTAPKAARRQKTASKTQPSGDASKRPKQTRRAAKPKRSTQH